MNKVKTVVYLVHVILIDIWPRNGVSGPLAYNRTGEVHSTSGTSAGHSCDDLQHLCNRHSTTDRHVTAASRSVPETKIISSIPSAACECQDFSGKDSSMLLVGAMETEASAYVMVYCQPASLHPRQQWQANTLQASWSLQIVFSSCSYQKARLCK